MNFLRQPSDLIEYDDIATRREYLLDMIVGISKDKGGR